LPPETELRVVLGSATPPGRLRRALEGAVGRAVERGSGAELLDLAEWRVSLADGRDPAELEDDTGAVVDAVAAAGALVFATPVYRGSMTGVLKNLFDLVPVPALQGKVVGLVAMGASDHHFLGAERHLRDVLSFFGAVAMPVAVYLTNRDFEDGEPTAPAAATLDELLAATAATAAALSGTEIALPAPLAARSIRPAAARAGAGQGR